MLMPIRFPESLLIVTTPEVTVMPLSVGFNWVENSLASLD